MCGDAGHNKRTCPEKSPRPLSAAKSTMEGYDIGDIYYFKSYGMKQPHQGEIVAVYPNEPELCVDIRDWVDGSTRAVPVAILALKKSDATNKSTEYFLTTNNN